MQSSSSFKTFIQILALAALYFVLGIAGLELAIPPGYATAIFPASGIAVAGILYGGNRLLPGVWLGSFGINLWIAFGYGDLELTSLLIAVIIGVGSSLQAFIASYLIKNIAQIKWQHLTNNRDIAQFLLLTGPVACLISASWANATLFSFNLISTENIAANWLNWWIGDVTGVLLFAPLALLVLLRKQAPWRNRLKTIALPIFVAAISVVSAFFYVSFNESRQINNQLNKTSTAISYNIKTKINAYKETVASVRSLINHSPNLTYSEFDKFTQPLFSTHPDLQALGWNPLITEEERGIFEAELSKELGYPYLEIKQHDLQGELVRAESRSWYVPVAYISPLASNKKAIGYDIASNSIRLDAINNAIALKKEVMTAPIRLVQESGTSVAILLLAPTSTVYSNNVTGFAVGVIRIEDMMRDLFSLGMTEEIDILLEDKNSPAPDRLLFSSNKNLTAISNYDYHWKTNIFS